MSTDSKSQDRGRSAGTILRQAWRRGRSLLPVEGYAFARPLVVLQSDDWGRVGVRDGEGWQELVEMGMSLGERSYDFYSLETAEDVAAVGALLQSHHDSTGRSPCLEMNFVVANVDFARVKDGNFHQIHLRRLSDGLPDGWKRHGLFEAYRHGISGGLFSPALHGTTHFCQPAVARHLNGSGERGVLLRALWKAGVPYIHWRMPWIGFEYWDPESPDEEDFLTGQAQQTLIDVAAESFAAMFGRAPRSACAPGYRANQSTLEAWAKRGVRVAQNGPGSALPPHFDHGILQLSRSVDFEPATAQELSIDSCLRAAEECFARGLPAIISVHSINFHSTIKDFRGPTLRLLDQFLSALEAKHPDLLYVNDEDLYDLVEKGLFQSTQSTVRVPVTKRMFSSGAVAAGWRA